MTLDATLDVALTHGYAGGPGIDMAFQAPGQGVTALFGPSGAGKSTVIAACAGLLRPARCRIAVGGAVLADTDRGIWVPPERRRVGLVFQEARLFPHMSVATNLRFGQRRAPPDGTDPGAAFDAVVALLGLGALLRRRPHTLSGGERQRVAIGRALLARPRLLLMDEPLASLDAGRKAEILPYLARLAATAAVPVLYVTHSAEELVRLADHVVLIEAGRCIASGPLTTIASQAGSALAGREDAGAVLPCRVAAHDPGRGLTLLEAEGVALLVPLLDAAPGTGLRVRVPAREVILAAPEATALAASISLHNLLPGIVRAVAPGPTVHSATVEVAVGAHALLSRVTADAVERLALAPGRPVLALVKSVAVAVVRTG